MKNKTIYFTVTNDLTADQRMHRITRTLAEEGRRVVLIGRKLNKNQKNRQIIKNVEWIRFSLFFKKGKFFYLEYNLRLVFYLMFKRNKIVSSVDFDTLPAVFILKLFSRFPFVFDAHEYFTEVPELKGRKLEKTVWEKIGGKIIPLADRCYTVNESISTIYSALYSRTFHVIRNVPYTSNIAKEERETYPRVILYQGALNQGRGLEESILMMKSFTAYELWLAGNGDVEESLRRLVIENNLQDTVKFLGRLEPEELKVVTSKAWAGLNILHGDSLNYYYSLANKFFDYVHASVPGISMRYPEYINLNEAFKVAELISECTIDNLIEAVHLLEDPAFYQKIKRNCISASEVWCWEKEKLNLLKVYDQL